jgi:hypothetical protein
MAVFHLSTGSDSLCLLISFVSVSGALLYDSSWPALFSRSWSNVRDHPSPFSQAFFTTLIEHFALCCSLYPMETMPYSRRKE